MRFFSATDHAISTASARGTLRLTERPSRFGNTFVSIEDDRGTIEVQDDMSAAERRVRECTR